MQNAKCKMQNAKLMRPFACAKAYFMVIFCMQIPKKHLPTKRFFKENFSRVSLSRSLILHFAFRILHFGLCPTNPKFELRSILWTT